MKITENALKIYTAAYFYYLKKIKQEVKSEAAINKRIRRWVIEENIWQKPEEALLSFFNEKKAEVLHVTLDKFQDKKEELREALKKKFLKENCCDGLIAIGDPDFPICRGDVKSEERPIYLFYKGNIDLLSEKKCVSVIGLLNPEGNIEERERKLVRNLVKEDVVVVSGLAQGCDSIAHDETLEAGGKTVAILPSPLTSILPAKNRPLAYKIIEEGGLLITEYGREHKDIYELASRYKERDRLQALFCDTIILAASYAENSYEKPAKEAYKKLSKEDREKIVEKEFLKKKKREYDSGARLAMASAGQYRIPRAVMYEESDAENLMFDLNRQLRDERAICLPDEAEIQAKNIKELLTILKT